MMRTASTLIGGPRRAATLAVSALALLLIAACATRHLGAPPVGFVVNDSLRLYVAHAEQDWPGVAEQQSMTADTLERLADAIASLAQAQGAVPRPIAGRLSALRSSTATFALGKPGTVAQAAALRETFVTAASLTRLLVESTRAAETQGTLAALERAATGIDADKPLPQQADAIEHFFLQAAAALERVDAIGRDY
jgi:hypothetical protein